MIDVSAVTPCQRGSFKGDHIDNMCPHATAERIARLEENKRNEDEKAEKMKGKEEKIIELLSQQALNAADKDGKILELLETLGIESGRKIKQKRKDEE
jgi:hypothetical protein